MSQSIKEALNSNGYIIHSMKGISMLPLFIEDEDLVQIEPVNSTLNKLDMVLYTRKNENSYVLHRILDIKNNYYLICGDNQDTLEKVYRDQIIGKVVGYYKKGRYISIEDDEYIEYLNNLELNLNKRIHLNGVKPYTKQLISLIRATIHNTNIDQSNYDFKNIYKLAKSQNISAFIYKSIDCNLCDKDTYSKFCDDYNMSIQRTLLFDNERSKIYNSLNENGIKYVPLKGIIINTFYPIYGTRQFSDNDIYYDSSKSINNLMKDLGYELKYNTRIEKVYYKKPIYNFEMHQCLFNDEYDFSKYFNNIFDIAISNKDYEYKLSNEDFYAYFLAHLYKHYNGAGAGIRFYIDLHYILKNMKFNEDTLNDILAKTHLIEFNKEVIQEMNYLLNSDEYDLLTINKVFAGGTYGNRDMRIDKDIASKGKLKYIKDRVFPSAKTLSWSRPYLKKYPYLVIFVWIYRIINPNGWKRIINEIKHLIK